MYRPILRKTTFPRPLILQALVLALLILPASPALAQALFGKTA